MRAIHLLASRTDLARRFHDGFDQPFTEYSAARAAPAVARPRARPSCQRRVAPCRGTLRHASKPGPGAKWVPRAC
eukprot:3021748-Prymnesium_polylepis.1